MRLTYDPKHNVAYLAFRDKPCEVETLQLSAELNVDIAADGTLYGIEFLNANTLFADGREARLIIDSADHGRLAEIALSDAV